MSAVVSRGTVVVCAQCHTFVSRRAVSRAAASRVARNLYARVTDRLIGAGGAPAAVLPLCAPAAAPLAPRPALGWRVRLGSFSAAHWQPY